MPAPEASRDIGRVAAGARVDDIRRALAATTDPSGRARLRVRLADVLSALGDAPAAVAELKQAAAEAPRFVGLAFAARAVAAGLPARDAQALLAEVGAVRPAKPAPSSRRAGLGARPTRASSSSNREHGVVLPIPPVPLPSTLGAGTGQAPPEPIDEAFAALAVGKPVRARRLGEEVARLGGLTAQRPGRLRDLVKALDQHGAKREALRLARTLAETDGGPVSIVAAAEALEAIVERATQIQDGELAGRWGTDLGRQAARAGTVEPASSDQGGSSVRDRFRSAQRAVLAAEGGNPDAAVARLLPLFGDPMGGAAALALAERVVTKLGDHAASRRADLLRMAFDAERDPRRREKLGVRWAEALTSLGDAGGALAALDRAVAGAPADVSGSLRRARAALLRTPGREADLARVLRADAEAETGAARIALRAEQADLLDKMGDFDSALEVRLAALKDAPGDLGLLAPARQRLEAVGRLDRSLELATAAISHVGDRGARAGLLRDVGTLAEVAAGDGKRAATAWLEVVSLFPDDAVACDAAERLLRQTGDRNRLGALLAWSAARQVDSETRASVLWRLAEFRRVEQQAPISALALYREIIEARGGAPESLPFTEEDWQRRDDALAVQTARALAAPTSSARAQAIAERAAVLIDAARLDEADRDLGRALELDPAVFEVVRTFERLYEQRGDWKALRQRLAARVDGAVGAAAAHLWFGIGRANDRLGDPGAARAAYERATTADASFRAPVAMLRQLAVARADFPEMARLLEKEIELCPGPGERVGLLVELGVLLADRLERAPRAVEVLDAALAFAPANAAALDAMFAAALTAGLWEKAAQALEAMLAAGLAVPDAGQRYHQVGLHAEKAGQVDRALGLYSRSYARNPAFRPTLERLSEICFERQQWDNAWKATEHLIERHGTDLDAGTRATLALRSALADLHVAQRLVAAGRIAGMLGGKSPSAGLRDVADSWASMRFDPRLLGGVEGDRRARVLSRLAEVLALTDADRHHPARMTARETLAALAVVDRRWADALSLLDAFGADGTLDAGRRCLFLVAAGDVLLHQQGDVAGAALRYQRAGAINPREPRLARAGIVSVARDESGDQG